MEPYNLSRARYIPDILVAFITSTELLHKETAEGLASGIQNSTNMVSLENEENKTVVQHLYQSQIGATKAQPDGPWARTAVIV